MEAQLASRRKGNTNLPSNVQALTSGEHSASLTPLVTFVIYAYNEEKYIKSAIEGAFAQDYSPLEIFLSDDGSLDRTFEIMQEMAAGYKGPHTVSLNRNVHNVGIGSQLNACLKESKGDLILLANGDDISLPERTRLTVDAWLTSGKKAHAIYSDLEEIDEEGILRGTPGRKARSFDTLEEGVRKRFSGGALAASLTLSRSVFDRFGPLTDNLILEDNPLHMRAMLLGDCVHLDRSLVKYRVHAENMSQAYAHTAFETWVKRYRERLVWQKREGIKAYLQMLRDLYQLPAERWPAQDLKEARWAGMEMLLENTLEHDYYAGDRSIGLRQRWKSLCRLSLILTKLWLKTVFPVIERRNERWHYKNVLPHSD